MDCPHCGGVIDPGAAKPLLHAAFDDDAHAIGVDGTPRHVTPSQWLMLRLLRERYRRFVPVAFLAQETARDSVGGGSVMSLRAQLCVLRRQLAGAPFAIASQHGYGYGLFPADEVEVAIRRDGHRRVRWPG
jgi:hypothetical protein